MEHNMKRNTVLEIGKVYKNRGGGEFRCLDSYNDDSFCLVNTKSHWRLTAHNITMYDDGTIEWDYSSNGFFEA